MRRSNRVNEQPVKAIEACIECKVNKARHWDNKLCEICLIVMLSEANIKEAFCESKTK